jgi:fimbrial isopeptide formation D2 family protein/LPXTG-motif cell wall-anchored protein
MQTLKKLLSVFTALLMSIGMGITPIMAEEATSKSTTTEKGSITIINAQQGVSYDLYRLFEASLSDKDDENGVANSILYIATEAQKTIIENDKSSGDKVGLASLFEFAACDGNSTEKNENNKYYVTLAKDVSSDTVTQALKKYIESSSTDTAGNTTVTNSYGALFTKIKISADDITRERDGLNLTISNLKPGYYFINSSLGTLVTITSAQPKAVVTDKNLLPSSEKDTFKTVIGVNDSSGTARSSTDSAAIGDTITYRLTINVTNYAENQNISSYIFEDSLGKGLAYNTTKNTTSEEIVGIEDLKVTLSGVTNETDAVTISSFSDDPKSAKSFKYDAVSAESFKIVVPWTDDDGNLLYSFTNGTGTLIVEYTATVLDSVDELTSLTNSASWSYTTGNPIDGGTDPDTGKGDPENPVPGDDGETTTYSYGFSIYSYEAMTGDNGALSGAVYQISEKDSTTALKFTKDGDVYKYDPTNGSTSVTSDENGYITILGLAEGTYTIQEITAPAGYNKFTESKDADSSLLITKEPKDSTEENTEKVDGTTPSAAIETPESGDGKEESEKDQEDEAKNPLSDTVNIHLDKDDKKLESSENATVNYYSMRNVNVGHTNGVALPSTGGIGTTIFYVIGSLLVVGAVVLLLTNRKLKKLNQQ